MVSVDVLIIIVGIIYGYVHPGKEDRMHILKKGLRYGFIIGVIFGFIGLFTGSVSVALASGFVGIIGFVIVALIISLEFVIGTFVGDFLEEKIKK
ncbi:MAG: hypothetical protein V3R82_01855 [Candidatus Hydrothermarchaeales archaeon]